MEMSDYEIFDLNGLKLCVNADFRFGTDAVLLSRFVKTSPRQTICDLCSGSGIVPFMLYGNEKSRPHRIYSLDIASEASELLKKSIELNSAGEVIIPITEDLKNITQIPRESVDIVTVNPPYFKNGSGANRKSSAQALARHEIMCTVADVSEAAAKLLKYGGELKMCQIPDRLADVIYAMRSNKIEPKKLLFVSTRNDKDKTSPWLFLISGKKGAKSGLIVEHTFTEEVLCE